MLLFARQTTRLLTFSTLMVFVLLLPPLLQADQTLIVTSAAADDPPTTQQNGQDRSPLRLLMNFVSRADGERCPMHPTCSHYARQAFAEKGLLMGWVLTSDRLLRCGRDETRLAPKVRIDGVPHAHDPLSANIFWWDNP